MLMFLSMMPFFGLLVIFVDFVEDVACCEDLEAAEDNHLCSSAEEAGVVWMFEGRLLLLCGAVLVAAADAECYDASSCSSQ